MDPASFGSNGDMNPKKTVVCFKQDSLFYEKRDSKRIGLFFLLVPVLSQFLFPFMGCNFMSFSLSSTRHWAAPYHDLLLYYAVIR